VGRLAGTALAEMTDAVPATLQSVSSCTHLNDLLRSLTGADTLVAAAGEVRGAQR
jgi:hypothetical protein